jgi:hypothetical protein
MMKLILRGLCLYLFPISQKASLCTKEECASLEFLVLGVHTVMCPSFPWTRQAIKENMIAYNNYLETFQPRILSLHAQSWD